MNISWFGELTSGQLFSIHMSVFLLCIVDSNVVFLYANVPYAYSYENYELWGKEGYDDAWVMGPS